MSKDAGTWMPLYIGDYLGDTQRLSTEQHGAYLLLILDYWRNGPPPDDDVTLAQIARLNAKAWKRHRPALARLFQPTDGEWRHKRIDKELTVAAENSARRSSKAKAAADARWGQSSQDAPSNAQSMPGAMLGECPPPSPSSEPKGSSEISDAIASSPDALRPEHVVEAWNEMAGRKGLAAVRTLSPARKQRLRARIRDHPIDQWMDALSAIERSPFLTGDNERGWRADFDFLLQPSSFAKLIEGSYDRKH